MNLYSCVPGFLMDHLGFQHGTHFDLHCLRCIDVDEEGDQQRGQDDSDDLPKILRKMLAGFGLYPITRIFSKFRGARLPKSARSRRSRRCTCETSEVFPIL